MSDAETALTGFLRVLDALEERDRPIYSETCQCGASMAISRDIPQSERRRMYANFLGRHNHKRAEHDH